MHKFRKSINKNSKYPNYYIYVVQGIVCIFVLIILFMIKFFNQNSYFHIKNWIKFQLNDSLIANNNSKNGKCFALSLSENVPVHLTVKFSRPVNNGLITSGFGKRVDPITKIVGTTHNGIDIGTNSGENIYSVLPGYVELAKYFGGYGNCVIINHGNNIQTLYAHCQKIDVNPGEVINKGQKIATVGSTGRSSGPHLHFEVKINETNFSPEIFLDNIYSTKNEI